MNTIETMFVEETLILHHLYQKVFSDDGKGMVGPSLDQLERLGRHADMIKTLVQAFQVSKSTRTLRR